MMKEVGEIYEAGGDYAEAVEHLQWAAEDLMVRQIDACISGDGDTSTYITLVLRIISHSPPVLRGFLVSCRLLGGTAQ